MKSSVRKTRVVHMSELVGLCSLCLHDAVLQPPPLLPDLVELGLHLDALQLSLLQQQW